MRVRASAGVVVALTLALSACGPATGSPAPSVSASPSATAACAVQEGVELPPGCAPYDPDQAMAQNDRYRERMSIDNDDHEKVARIVADVRQRLEALRLAGPTTERAVRSQLDEAGLTDVQTRVGAGDVLFGAVPPGGGCVYGAVTPEEVTVDAGGYILDGGCLPAQ